jgi:hypothetical protein
MIHCQKCGAAIVSDETLLQRILDAMEETNRKARCGKAKERNVFLQMAAEYKAIYKAVMHNITQRERAERETPYVLSELASHLISTGMMTAEEIEAIRIRGVQKAAVAYREADAEIQRVYGDFEGIVNHRSSPTERAVLGRCRK